MTNFQISKPASEAFADIRERMFASSQMADRLPSASVTVEFLCWFFNQSQMLGEAPDLADFEPETRRGRPRSYYGRGTLRPIHIRKLAGVDPVTAERKLR